MICYLSSIQTIIIFLVKMNCFKRIKKLFKKKKQFVSKFFCRVRQIFKRKSSIFELNDDCLREVFMYLNRRDISAMCTIRNNRLKSVGERVFVRNHGNSMKVTKRNINDEIITCRAFGHLIKKFSIEFQRNEIKMAINFVEQHLHSDLEELELIHLRENNPGKAGERKLGNFIRGLDNRFRNLKHLSIDYRNDEKWCSYIMAIPILQNVETITINGMVHLADVMDIFNMYRGGTGVWNFHFLGNGLWPGYLLTKTIQ